MALASSQRLRANEQQTQTEDLLPTQANNGPQHTALDVNPPPMPQGAGRTAHKGSFSSWQEQISSHAEPSIVRAICVVVIIIGIIAFLHDLLKEMSLWMTITVQFLVSCVANIIVACIQSLKWKRVATVASASVAVSIAVIIGVYLTDNKVKNNLVWVTYFVPFFISCAANTIIIQMQTWEWAPSLRPTLVHCSMQTD
jgi:cation transport ATPase